MFFVTRESLAGIVFPCSTMKYYYCTWFPFLLLYRLYGASENFVICNMFHDVNYFIVYILFHDLSKSNCIKSENWQVGMEYVELLCPCKLAQSINGINRLMTSLRKVLL